jgi:hypothetical protein
MMRVSDTALVVSAVFHVAEQTGSHNVSPGMVTSYVCSQFGVNLPLHQVVDILRDVGVVTHTVANHRYIVWNEDTMSELKGIVNKTESDMKML